MLPGNTYQGRRADLRETAPDEDETELMEKEEIKNLALSMTTPGICHAPGGIIASELAFAASCTKEWARKVLLELVAEGRLRIHRAGNIHLFFLVGIDDDVNVQ